METLEEAAKSEAFEFKVDYKPFKTDLDYREYAEYGFEKGFVDGAKWQAERMYTYDDIRFIAYNAFCLGQMDNPRENKFNGWIEQFKKK